MAGKKVMKLASRGKRFGAAMIDMVPSWILSIGAASVAIENLVNQLQGMMYGNYGYMYGYGYETANTTNYWSILMWLLLAVQIYFCSRGQSIGKAILGLRVVDNKSGKKLGFWKMVLRELIVKPAGGSAFLLGYIWVLIDDYNRGWHDKILDTYVVDERASSAANAGNAARDGAADVSAAIRKSVDEARPADQSAAASVEVAAVEEVPAVEEVTAETIATKPETVITCAEKDIPIAVIHDSTVGSVAIPDAPVAETVANAETATEAVAEISNAVEETVEEPVDILTSNNTEVVPDTETDVDFIPEEREQHPFENISELPIEEPSPDNMFTKAFAEEKKEAE